MAGVCGGEKGSNSTITTGLLAHCVGWELRECSSGAAGTTIKGKPQCVSLGSARKPVRSGRHAMTSHAQHGDSGDETCGCPAVSGYVQQVYTTVPLYPRVKARSIISCLPCARQVGREREGR